MALFKVKICGITNSEDALAAVDMGADILGFNFYPKSPRYIDPADALDIINKLPTFVDTAGVFVNAEYEHIKQLNEIGFLNWIQLHGDETPEFCESLRWLSTRTIKAIRVKNSDDIKAAEQYPTDAVLFDTYDPNCYGGTGKTFNWSMICTIHKRIFLAGGINPDNVIQALEIGVYGIDICSGIEERPGKKDLKKMKKLFENIRQFTGSSRT